MQHVVWIAVLVGACGQPVGSGGGAPDAALEVDAPADAAPDAMEPVRDTSCRDVKARLATTADGVHWIDPDLEGASYRPFRVFCAAMNTATPKEYLELARTSPPAEVAASNYSTYATGAPHGQWTCDCGVTTSVFTKIRIDPMTLVVEVADTSYAVFAASTQVTCLQTKSGCPGATPYGIASACVTNNDASGRANIDLRGMPFHVAGTDGAMFTPGGFTPAGSAMLDAERKVVELTGGGDCGSFGARGGLALAQDF